MSNKLFFPAIILVLIVALVFVFNFSNSNDFEILSSFKENIKIYKSQSCGCCGAYSNYFQRKGNPALKVINLDDIDALKENYGVPLSLRSCHTTIIGDYFVEGHVPLEAIEKLLQEKQDIKGIAMPGMPSGSPGMPGVKTGEFIIYAINNDGSYEEFMRI